MKLCRFNGDLLGLVDGDQVLNVSEALEASSAMPAPCASD